MNFLLYFYLAHFLSDYPLQSNAMVRYKRKSFWGVLLHSTVHLVSLLVILSPFLCNWRVWLAIAIVYASHNIIDQTKVALDKANPKRARINYFVDQLAHWTFILLAATVAGELAPKGLTGWALEFYTNQTFFLYLLVMVLSTYFYDVTRYFIRLKMFTEELHRDYRTMLMNAVIVTVAFGVYWAAY